MKKAPPPPFQKKKTHDDAVRAAVVGAGDGAEALLAGGVPLRERGGERGREREMGKRGKKGRGKSVSDNREEGSSGRKEEQRRQKGKGKKMYLKLTIWSFTTLPSSSTVRIFCVLFALERGRRREEVRRMKERRKKARETAAVFFFFPFFVLRLRDGETKNQNISSALPPPLSGRSCSSFCWHPAGGAPCPRRRSTLSHGQKERKKRATRRARRAMTRESHSSSAAARAAKEEKTTK